MDIRTVGVEAAGHDPGREGAASRFQCNRTEAALQTAEGPNDKADMKLIFTLRTITRNHACLASRDGSRHDICIPSETETQPLSGFQSILADQLNPDMHIMQPV
jgi:hypothetical protein